MVPKTKIERYLEDVILISTIQTKSESRKREKDIKIRTKDDLSHRLLLLHRQGTLKIKMARFLDSDNPSEAIVVVPEDPTERQLHLYLYGVSKLRDERKNKNRAEKCISPQNATERQLSMYRSGVLKLRNELLKITTFNFCNSKVQSSGIYYSPSHNVFSQQKFVQELYTNNVQETSKKRHCVEAKEITKTTFSYEGTGEGKLCLSDSESQHPCALEELEKMWKVLRPRRTQSVSKSGLSDVVHTKVQSFDIMGSEQSIASDGYRDHRQYLPTEERGCIALLVRQFSNCGSEIKDTLEEMRSWPFVQLNLELMYVCYSAIEEEIEDVMD